MWDLESVRTFRFEPSIFDASQRRFSGDPKGEAHNAESSSRVRHIKKPPLRWFFYMWDLESVRTFRFEPSIFDASQRRFSGDPKGEAHSAE
jgi:hypothetical protein